MRGETFELREEHLVLLANMYIEEAGGGWGGPTVDTKRPYGNSDMIADIARILGIEGFVDHDDEVHYSKGQYDHMVALHEQTTKALQIILQIPGAKPGPYVQTDPYDIKWEKVERV